MTPLSTNSPKESVQAGSSLSSKKSGHATKGSGTPAGACVVLMAHRACLCSQCTDGLGGNGTCICQDGFQGSRCQFCSDPNTYGPRCDKSKWHFQSFLLFLSQDPGCTAANLWCRLGVLGPLLGDAVIIGHFSSAGFSGSNIYQVTGVSETVDLGWRLRICIANKFPGEADHCWSKDHTWKISLSRFPHIPEVLMGFVATDSLSALQTVCFHQLLPLQNA